MNKLKKISLQNFRGVRNALEIELNEAQSFLLYGDNGSGKSSISDAIEWFFKDKVDHLSGEEIGPNEGLRHALSKETEESYVELLGSSKELSSRKTLKIVKGKLKAEFLNKDESFEKYLQAAAGENLFIRNQDLIQFIVATKGERLADISNIIGYSDINDTKAVLKKAASDVKSQLKARSFDNAIGQKQAQIATQLNATVNDDSQFVRAVADLVAPLKLSLPVTTIQDVSRLKLELSAGQNNPDADLAVAVSLAISKVETLGAQAKSALVIFEQFVESRAKLLKDAGIVAQISEGQLLLEAQKLLAGPHTADDCPLCLQKVNRDELVQSIASRIKKLKEVRDRMAELDSKRTAIVRELGASEAALNHFSTEAALKRAIENGPKTLLDSAREVARLREKCVTSGIDGTVDLAAEKQVFLSVESQLLELATGLKKFKDELPPTAAVNPRIDISSRLAVAEMAYGDINKLKYERSVLEAQSKTLETMFSEFVETQRREMSVFLKSISADINSLYQFMNSAEKVDAIELVTVDDKNGEFNGVAFKFSFHGLPVQSPKEYLSESHLNCLGLCLFLASVKAFNKKNGFFALDDVISSFDKNHRLLFARLLVEQFEKYQMLIFTHEREWFELLASDVKGKGWRINSTQWDVDSGVSLDLPSVDIKNQIDVRIKKGESIGLGNLLRRFGERLLKEISVELEVDIPFRLNDRNEQRTFDELLGAFKRKLNAKAAGIKDSPVIARLGTSQFLGNKTSHDNAFEEVLADLKVCYKDLCELEGLVKCAECGKALSIRYYDKVAKKARCKCGKLEVNWKE